VADHSRGIAEDLSRGDRAAERSDLAAQRWHPSNIAPLRAIPYRRGDLPV
jgi:hypothetical protein